jgi:hypothetical protein
MGGGNGCRGADVMPFIFCPFRKKLLVLDCRADTTQQAQQPRASTSAPASAPGPPSATRTSSEDVSHSPSRMATPQNEAFRSLAASVSCSAGLELVSPAVIHNVSLEGPQAHKRAR